MYEQGQIVLVPFPFTDLSATRVRPAVILSKNNLSKADVLLSFVSSNLDGENTYAIEVTPSATNGLKVPSVIRFDKLATLDKRIVIGSIGSLPKNWLRKNQKTFLDVFGL